MRVLWIDADGAPWSGPDGWDVLKRSVVDVHRVSTCAEANPLLTNAEFDLILVRAELRDAPSVLVTARKIINRGGNLQKLILISSSWTKEQFRLHAKTEGAAHRYARVPMPADGFLKMVTDLFGKDPALVGTPATSSGLSLSMPSLNVGSNSDAGAGHSALDLLSLGSSQGPSLDIGQVEAESPKKSRKRADAKADAGDSEVLRNYLRIKEEQLELSEGERDELSRENERLQKEAHLLQSKLREFEHLHDELTKKVSLMEAERVEAERRRALEQEEADRASRQQGDKIKTLEGQLSEAGEKYENLRVRVRKDIRKIRENERDLEARLELMRKDSATLLQARDEKVLDLQRKIDALEFDLDQVQDSRVQAQMEAERYLAKLSRVARALHISVGMIEADGGGDDELDELDPILGGAANAEEPAAASAAIAESTSTAPAVEGEENADHSALANDGEATQMLAGGLSGADSAGADAGGENVEGEPESNSG